MDELQNVSYFPLCKILNLNKSETIRRIKKKPMEVTCEISRIKNWSLVSVHFLPFLRYFFLSHIYKWNIALGLVLGLVLALGLGLGMGLG